MIEAQKQNKIGANSVAAAFGDAMAVNALCSTLQIGFSCARILETTKNYWLLVPAGQEAAQLSDNLFKKRINNVK